MNVKRVTSGPHHHFFGFHDLPQSSRCGRYLLSLEVEDISHPPLAGETAGVGVVDLSGDGRFHEIFRTFAYNYPQGARQQWLGDSLLFLTNDMVDGFWGSRLADAESLSVVDVLPFPIHCVDPVRGVGYFINYARLGRLGVYGYVGGKDPFSMEDIPKEDGIFVGELCSKKAYLLCSIHSVASCGESRPVRTGFPHYVTHLSLSPSRDRIAFLHRYRLPDGGETTRLMTIGVDGKALRCLAKGSLSHFEWVDNKRIIIWGAHLPNSYKLRESSLIRAVGGKHILRILRTVKRCFNGEGGASGRSSNFLEILDNDPPEYKILSPNLLREDGHPMVNPCYREWCSFDTYPNEKGDRELFLYNYAKRERIDIGVFRRLFKEPSPDLFDVDSFLSEFDKRVLKTLDADALRKILFTKSGYHCDLHPRWGGRGDVLYFDSIHEGSRQIYSVDISAITNKG